MWDKIFFITIITVFFPWSLLVMLWMFGWDETVRIFRELIIETFGLTIMLVCAAVMILLTVGLVAFVVALIAR